MYSFKRVMKDPVTWALLIFLLIVLIQIPFSAKGDPYDLTNDLIFGPPGESRKTALAKLEDRDEQLLVFVNELKNAAASTTAPDSPSVGQFWFDTTNNEMKQFYASTWTAIYSFASTTEAGWAGSFSAPYASITDVDVVSAEIGSATIDTLVALNATVGNLNVNTINIVNTFEGAFVYHSASQTITDDSVLELAWDTELYDVGGWHVAGTNTRFTVPSGVEYVVLKAEIRFGYLTTMATDATPFANAYIEMNGSQIPEGSGYYSKDWTGDLAPVAVGVSDSVFMKFNTSAIAVTAGDYFTLWMYEDNTDGYESVVYGSTFASSFAVREVK